MTMYAICNGNQVEVVSLFSNMAVIKLPPNGNKVTVSISNIRLIESLPLGTLESDGSLDSKRLQGIQPEVPPLPPVNAQGLTIKIGTDNPNARRPNIKVQETVVGDKVIAVKPIPTVANSIVPAPLHPPVEESKSESDSSSTPDPTLPLEGSGVVDSQSVDMPTPEKTFNINTLTSDDITPVSKAVPGLGKTTLSTILKNKPVEGYQDMEHLKSVNKHQIPSNLRWSIIQAYITFEG